MAATKPTLEEKRQVLLQYLAAVRDGHHYFKTHDGDPCEGYIVEVGEVAVIFMWAPSPFDHPDLVDEEVSIPIEVIDTTTLK